VSPPSTRPGTRAERNRDQTTQRLLAAVGEVLARDGFTGLGVNAVAKQAGVDKVLLYRYFGGLPELLRAWGESGQFWPSIAELRGEGEHDITRLPLAARYAAFMNRFVDALRQRPLTVEILASEVAQRNELTIILETEREQWGQGVGELLGGQELVHRPELKNITLVLIAGVQYLLVRGRTIRVFGGVDIGSDEGWQELKQSIELMAQRLLG
jgi:AcrR family transcriptional regulator